MRRSTLSTVGGAAAGFVVAAGLVARRLGKRAQRPRELRHARPDQMHFEEVVPGASRAILWGDPETGPYAAFVRFEPGARLPLHTHTNPIALVVVSGAYLQGSRREGEIRVEAGEYLYNPAGSTHWSGADAQAGCLFYEEGPDRFDIVFAEEQRH